MEFQKNKEKAIESIPLTNEKCQEIYSDVYDKYLGFCNELLEKNNALIYLYKEKERNKAPKLEIKGVMQEEKKQEVPRKVILPKKMPENTIRVDYKYTEPVRRIVYTPMNDMYALNRKIDYIPYFGDGSVDIVTKVMSKHKEKIQKRWEKHTCKTELEDVFLYTVFSKFGCDPLTIKTFIEKFRPDYNEEKLIKRVNELFFKYGKEKKFKYMSIITGDITVENAMGTYIQMFCGICKKYDCLMHGLKSFDVFPHNQIISDLGPKLDDAQCCGSECFRVDTKDSLSLPSNFINTIASKVLSEFEISLLNKLYELYKKQPCKIASLLHNKEFPCKLVYLWIKENKSQFDVDLQDNQAINGKVKNGKKKRRVHQIQLYNILRMKKSLHFEECSHAPGESCQNGSCGCVARGFCEKYCLCSPNCPLRYFGCACKVGTCGTNACPCYASKRECDADICSYCTSTSSRCKNSDYFNTKPKKTGVSKSTVCEGWGLFALENIKKGEYIGSYSGEVIYDEEVDKRGEWDQYENLFYLFSVDDEYAIDAKYFGNKQRFINHSTNNPNCQPSLRFSQGCYRILFYAIRDVSAHEELFFNYDETGKLAETFPWAGNEEDQSDQKGKKHKCGKKQAIDEKRQVKKKKIIGDDESEEEKKLPISKEGTVVKIALPQNLEKVSQTVAEVNQSPAKIVNPIPAKANHQVFRIEQADRIGEGDKSFNQMLDLAFQNQQIDMKNNRQTKNIFNPKI